MRPFAGRSALETRWSWIGALGRGDYLCPVVHGPPAVSAGKNSKQSACGQAVASASFDALAVSTMRAPIFSSFSRKVTNSATASGLVLGCVTPIRASANSGGMQNEPHLIASGERQEVRSDASWLLCI